MKGNRDNPLVVIRCITYNHEPYIRDALEGFVMQQTNFPFVAIVHDDASTDGTAAIIREYAEKYPAIVTPLFETENQYSKHDDSLTRIMNAACDATGAKYIAVCEGDDYWTDPFKLQKQVDFLESHPEYGMCYTQCLYYYQSKKQLAPKSWGGPNETFEEFMNDNTVPTLTVLFRTELQKKYFEEINPPSKGWLMGDYPTWIWLSHESKIKFLPYCTGIYRVLVNSASHSTDIEKLIRFSASSIDIRQFYEKFFNVPSGTYVKGDYLERRKLYLYAINHKYSDFFNTIATHPKLILNLKVLGYLRFFLTREHIKM